MRRLIPMLVLAACASQQRSPPEPSNGWTPVEEAELHGRCVGGWLAHEAEPSAANALCACVTPRLTRAFPFAWFNDGKEMSPTEARTISDIHVSCARELALSSPRRRTAPQPGAEPGDVTAPDGDQGPGSLGTGSAGL